MTEERQLQYDIAYMKMAKAFGELSYAQRNKVGCIIVSKNGQVISQGFNGTPSGYDNCCEEKQIITYNEGSLNEYCEEILVTKREVLHAESNAIAKCAKWSSSTEGATIYITLSPCFECAKTIIQAGISRVCYLEEYRNTEGIDFLKQNNVKIDKIVI